MVVVARPITSRPRAGGDARGSAASRRARKVWMLATFGDGVLCPCVHCSSPLDFASVEADRIKPGASYKRSNIQPACRRCNAARSNNPRWSYDRDVLRRTV